MKLLMDGAAVGSRLTRAIVGVNETVAWLHEGRAHLSGAGGASGGTAAGCAGGVRAMWA